MAMLTAVFLCVALGIPSAVANNNECDVFQCADTSCPQVVLPTDANYNESREQFASKMSSKAVSDARLHPEMILFCSEKHHVVQAINFARQCGYKVSVRSGGHNYAGFSSCVQGQRCIQVDVAGLDNFTSGVDGIYNRVTLGAGLKLGKVGEKLIELNLSIPVGTCSGVGVGGHFQSSAQGRLIRNFGVGLDYVTSFEIAKADGSIAKVDPQSDPDLYWAVLGGSPGSWGVLLSYTIDAIDSGKYPHSHVGLYLLPYTRETFTTLTNNMLRLAQDEQNARDFEMGVSLLKIDAEPDATTGLWQHYIVVQAFYSGQDNGPWTSELEEKFLKPITNPKEHIRPILARPAWEPASVSKAIHSVMMTDFNTGGDRYHVHSMSSPRWLNESWVEAAAAELEERMKIPYMWSAFSVYPYGGEGPLGSQLIRNSGKNAHPMRDTKVHVDDWFFFRDTGANAKVAEERIANFRESTKKAWMAENSADKSWMTTNTLDSDEYLLTTSAEEKLHYYYPNKGWYDRLTLAKDAVDPTDLFSSAMTLPATASRTSQLLVV